MRSALMWRLRKVIISKLLGDIKSTSDDTVSLLAKIQALFSFICYFFRDHHSHRRFCLANSNRTVTLPNKTPTYPDFGGKFHRVFCLRKVE